MRPPTPIQPAPGQESVWDYPRPPRIDADHRQAEVRLGGLVIASSRRTLRILETSHPPTFAFPPEDVRTDLLEPAPGTSVCEWKGRAVYWTVVASGRRVERAAWSYPDPTPGFESIAGFMCFYPRPFECTVDGLEVEPQEGSFYGGWITPDVVGPFKGGPGSAGW